MRRYTPEFQSSNINVQNLSRKQRLRVLGVQAVCAGLDSRIAEPPQAPPMLLVDIQEVTGASGPA